MRVVPMYIIFNAFIRVIRRITKVRAIRICAFWPNILSGPAKWRQNVRCFVCRVSCRDSLPSSVSYFRRQRFWMHPLARMVCKNVIKITCVVISKTVSKNKLELSLLACYISMWRIKLLLQAKHEFPLTQKYCSVTPQLLFPV